MKHVCCLAESRLTEKARADLEFSQAVRLVAFRVVNSSPSRLKVVRRRSSMIKPLPKEALAITVHRAYMSCGALVVDVMPAKLPFADSRVMIVADLLESIFQEEPEDLLQQFSVWSASSESSLVSYTLNGTFGAECVEARVASVLMQKSATCVERSQGGPTMEEEVVACRRLCSDGVLERTMIESQPCYHLTAFGVRCLSPCLTLSVKRLALGVRDVARNKLGHASTYELVVLLEEKGFRWRRMPSKSSRPKPFAIDLHFPPDEVGPWHSCTISVFCAHCCSDLLQCVSSHARVQ